MVFVQKSNFFSIGFVGIIKSEKMGFFIFQIERNYFQTRKLTFLKVPKNKHFCRGIIHSFVPKLNFFSFGFYGIIKSEKMVFLIFWIETNDFQTRKGTFRGAPKNRPFPRRLVHGFCPKLKLFLISVLKKLCSKRSFLGVLDKKRINFRPEN